MPAKRELQAYLLWKQNQDQRVDPLPRLSEAKMMLIEHSMLYEHEEVTLAHHFLLQPTRPEQPSDFAKAERMQCTVS